MTWKDDEMDERSMNERLMNERLMSDDAVADAVLRSLDESPEITSGMAPSRDLWPDIEARIGARVLPLGRDSIQVRRVRRRPAWLAMAAAAAFLVASTAGVTYVLTKRFTPAGLTSSTQVATRAVPQIAAPEARSPASQPEQPEQTSTITTSEAPAQVASANTGSSSSKRRARSAHAAKQPTSRSIARGPATSLASYPVTGSDEARVTYDDEIARLHGVLDARRDQLDPATVATVEHNLHIIDDAIAQARAALVKDPHSRLLNEQLDRTLAKKTQLLRAATLLPSA